MLSKSQQICQEIDSFLKQYNRSVIQLKTMKGKLEETSGPGDLFRPGNVTIGEMKDSINSCEMGQYLAKDTLTNYAKEKKTVSIVQGPGV